MKRIICVLVSLFLLLTAGCSEKTPLPIYTAVPESAPVSTQEGVPEFLELLQKTGRKALPDCSNVTPEHISKNSEYRLFRFEGGQLLYLMYDGTISSVASWYDDAQNSFALADIDRDGAYELYCSIAGGSGILRSDLAYFDPGEKKLVFFEASYLWDLLRWTDTEGTLTLTVQAPAGPDEESGGGSPSGEPVGRVVLDGGSIALDHSGYEVPENHWTA